MFFQLRESVRIRLNKEQPDLEDLVSGSLESKYSKRTERFPELWSSKAEEVDDQESCWFGFTHHFERQEKNHQAGRRISSHLCSPFISHNSFMKRLEVGTNKYGHERCEHFKNFGARRR